MTKQSAAKQLNTIISKLSHLNYHIEGNNLGDAMQEIANVMNKVQTGVIDMKKIQSIKKKKA